MSFDSSEDSDEDWVEPDEIDAEALNSLSQSPNNVNAKSTISIPIASSTATASSSAPNSAQPPQNNHRITKSAELATPPKNKHESHPTESITISHLYETETHKSNGLPNHISHQSLSTSQSSTVATTHTNPHTSHMSASSLHGFSHGLHRAIRTPSRSRRKRRRHSTSDTSSDAGSDGPMVPTIRSSTTPPPNLFNANSLPPLPSQEPVDNSAFPAQLNQAVLMLQEKRSQSKASSTLMLNASKSNESPLMARKPSIPWNADNSPLPSSTAIVTADYPSTNVTTTTTATTSTTASAVANPNITIASKARQSVIAIVEDSDPISHLDDGQFSTVSQHSHFSTVSQHSAPPTTRHEDLSSHSAAYGRAVRTSSDRQVDPRSTRIYNKDTGEEFDIDNLPAAVTDDAMLSLVKLQGKLNINDEPVTNQVADSEIQKNKKKHLQSFFGKIFDPKKAEKIEDFDPLANTRVKVKCARKNKELEHFELAQTVSSAHEGQIWCMEFSKKGDYLATGGQDQVLRIWTIVGSTADSRRWNSSLQQQQNEKKGDEGSKKTDTKANGSPDKKIEIPPPADALINPVPYREFTAHRLDIIDISWSRGDFILSASMDQTVMLWHTSRSRCLCLFQHSDFVTAVHFHPTEDYLFMSGSFDSRLRLWNILEHRVVDWVHMPSLVTSATFSPNGRYAVVGLFDGQCLFYKTEGFRFSYDTTIECRNAKGKFKKGKKVTGLQYRPVTHPAHHEHGSPDLLISTNDSRIRLYSVSNFNMRTKFKGHSNTQLQMQARFSPDGELVICGSDDRNVFVWRHEPESTQSLFKSNTNRNDVPEKFMSHPAAAVVPVALFSPQRTIHYLRKFRTTFNPMIHDPNPNYRPLSSDPLDDGGDEKTPHHVSNNPSESISVADATLFYPLSPPRANLNHPSSTPYLEEQFEVNSPGNSSSTSSAAQTPNKKSKQPSLIKRRSSTNSVSSVVSDASLSRSTNRQSKKRSKSKSREPSYANDGHSTNGTYSASAALLNNQSPFITKNDAKPIYCHRIKHIIVTADYDGDMKVFLNHFVCKESSNVNAANDTNAHHSGAHHHKQGSSGSVSGVSTPGSQSRHRKEKHRHHKSSSSSQADYLASAASAAVANDSQYSRGRRQAPSHSHKHIHNQTQSQTRKSTDRRTNSDGDMPFKSKLSI